MITFQPISEETIYIAQEIQNSNRAYNEMENGKSSRSIEELKTEFLDKQTESLFIKLEDTYIGIVDYLMRNPKDGYPWIGLFMIHYDYQEYSFGYQAYIALENLLVDHGLKEIRLGVLVNNRKAHSFWESVGFTYIKNSVTNEKNEVYVYEKSLN
ncbi:GNAT family N-acetyltransferase [Pontibacillus yanchengensis]|uniref:GNAT family N-acetyltransferase n=2 Tax=Pontibacillus yanchengensis TaxID=462910 RepID=A0ACC7VE79_9BACI|nr:GNAT family N-acetyltransferase [Pontibacillus yanchengensis]MYL35403.1 GNAT family N-acetyltransferase [Pontibacillus yanchengensis]MYL52435.1 GNAT family N-acetyltransferase [Pontibacillus yanchengensis]